jgi:hypothetical protein
MPRFSFPAHDGAAVSDFGFVVHHQSPIIIKPAGIRLLLFTHSDLGPIAGHCEQNTLQCRFASKDWKSQLEVFELRNKINDLQQILQLVSRPRTHGHPKRNDWARLMIA